MGASTQGEAGAGAEAEQGVAAAAGAEAEQGVAAGAEAEQGVAAGAEAEQGVATEAGWGTCGDEFLEFLKEHKESIDIEFDETLDSFVGALAVSSAIREGGDITDVRARLSGRTGVHKQGTILVTSRDVEKQAGVWTVKDSKGAWNLVVSMGESLMRTARSSLDKVLKYREIGRAWSRHYRIILAIAGDYKIPDSHPDLGNITDPTALEFRILSWRFESHTPLLADAHPLQKQTRMKRIVWPTYVDAKKGVYHSGGFPGKGIRPYDERHTDGLPPLFHDLPKELITRVGTEGGVALYNSGPFMDLLRAWIPDASSFDNEQLLLAAATKAKNEARREQAGSKCTRFELSYFFHGVLNQWKVDHYDLYSDHPPLIYSLAIAANPPLQVLQWNMLASACGAKEQATEGLSEHGNLSLLHLSDPDMKTYREARHKRFVTYANAYDLLILQEADKELAESLKDEWNVAYQQNTHEGGLSTNGFHQPTDYGHDYGNLIAIKKTLGTVETQFAFAKNNNGGLIFAAKIKPTCGDAEFWQMSAHLRLFGKSAADEDANSFGNEFQKAGFVPGDAWCMAGDMNTEVEVNEKQNTYINDQLAPNRALFLKLIEKLGGTLGAAVSDTEKTLSYKLDGLSLDHVATSDCSFVTRNTVQSSTTICLLAAGSPLEDHGVIQNSISKVFALVLSHESLLTYQMRSLFAVNAEAMIRICRVITATLSHDKTCKPAVTLYARTITTNQLVEGLMDKSISVVYDRVDIPIESTFLGAASDLETESAKRHNQMTFLDAESGAERNRTAATKLATQKNNHSLLAHVMTNIELKGMYPDFPTFLLYMKSVVATDKWVVCSADE